MAGAPKKPDLRRFFLRRNLGPLILLLGVIFTVAIIYMGMHGGLPRWFLGLATIL